MYIMSVSGLVDLCSEQVVGESSIAQMQNYQGGLQHFVIEGGKNCMDMDTCSMHVHPTRLKMSKEMNQSISCALHAKL